MMDGLLIFLVGLFCFTAGGHWVFRNTQRKLKDCADTGIRWEANGEVYVVTRVYPE